LIDNKKVEIEMRQNNVDVVNGILTEIGNFLTAVSDRIEDNLDNNTREGSSKLGQEMCARFGLSEPLGIALASLYVRRHPDLDSKQGQGGGIYRPSLGVPTAKAKTGGTKTTTPRTKKVKAIPIVPGVNDFSARTAVATAGTGTSDLEEDNAEDLEETVDEDSVDFE
jgi:hypothetical protein